MTTPLSNFDISKEPLLDLLSDIQAGKIQLVDFQRSWCWDEARIRQLLTSVSLGFPVGSIMLLQHNQRNFQSRLVEGLQLSQAPEPAFLILDGQQRLTSLFMTLLSNNPVLIDRGKRYQLEKRWFYLDLVKALNYPTTPRAEAILSVKADHRGSGKSIGWSAPEKEFVEGIFPLSRVFNFSEWRHKFSEYWEYKGEKLELIERFEVEVIKKFEHYQMGLFVLKSELPKEAVCQIFVSNNRKICELSYFDLLTSSYAVSNFDLRSDWASREKRFKPYRVLSLLKKTDFLHAIALTLSYQRRVQAKNRGVLSEKLPTMASTRQEALWLVFEDYQRWAEPVTQAFEIGARFLHNQAIFAADDLPYPTLLVVLVCLITALGERVHLDWVRAKLTQWFYCAAVSSSYSCSRDTMAARDVVEVIDWLDNGSIPLTIQQAHIASDRLQSLVSSRGTVYRAISALLRRDGALDLLSGEPITSALYFRQKIENHHIFPVRWCVARGIPRVRYNSIVNKTPITAKTNKLLSAKAPSEYLGLLEAQGMEGNRLDEILRSHAIEPSALRSNDFDRFFEQRTKLLLEMLGNAMCKKLTPGP